MCGHSNLEREHEKEQHETKSEKANSRDDKNKELC